MRRHVPKYRACGDMCSLSENEHKRSLSLETQSFRRAKRERNFLKICHTSHRPVSPIASAASRISPNGDLYLHVYTIFIPQNFLSILPIINFALSTGYGAAIRIYCPTETTVPVVSLSPTGTRTESPTLIVKSSVL